MYTGGQEDALTKDWQGQEGEGPGVLGGSSSSSSKTPQPMEQPSVTPESTKVSTSSYNQLVSKHADRLGVDPLAALENMKEFSRLVGLVESNGNLTAKNIPQKGKEATSASGKYQFVKDSIEPAVNRLERTLGMQPWMAKVLKDKDVTALDDEQQTLLFMGDMLEKTGSDKYMKKIMASGDSEAMLQAYYKLHHTKPDAATKTRAISYFKGA